MSLDINLTNVQSKPIVVSANQTAENDRVYHVIANATFTDPTGVNGKGYFVVVRSGTSIVLGGNSYTAGETIYRIFNAGTWLNIALRPSTYESLSNKKTTLTDNSDTFYPSQKAVKTAVDLKVDAVAGKGLSENDFTNTLKTKLDGIQAGAEVNVNADWNATSGDAQILNKPTIPSVTGLVPYTGATQDVDLGEHELKAGQVEFDQTPTGTAGVAVMRWNDADGTVDLGLKGGNVTLQLGQEQLVRVVNKTATNINLLEANYQAVRVTGAQGQRLKVDLAQATNDVLSAETIGLVTETINNNQEGFITTSGLVRGINTTGSLQSETWADGDVVYLSPTTAGRITNVKPSAPNHLVIIGYVVSAHATQGSIFVKVDNGYELDELHNVAISTPLNNQSLVYETATTLWKNKALTASDVGAVATNSAITGATKTKISYDAKGLVTSGADATTADIADSTNKRYVTDANLTVIGNTSGTNTGDNIAIIGGSQFTNTAISGSERFIHPYTTTVSTQESARQIVVPCSMRISKFFIQTGNSQSATGSHVLTLRKNGVDTSVQVTIPAGSASGVFSDTANSVTFNAGDLLGIRMINNASGSAAQINSISLSN